MSNEEEDDYLSMSFTDVGTKSAVKETSLQRTARLKREAAQRGRTLSKAEIKAKEDALRDAGLMTKLDATTNKGAKLMAKMGFKGGALGAADNQGRENPIEVELREGRGGIGMDSEKKRKLREAGEAHEAIQKKVKMTEADFRERVRQENEDKRVEGQWWGAMKILESVEEEDEEEEEEDDDDDTTRKPTLRSVNLLYRPLIKNRREEAREQSDLRQSQQRLSSKYNYDDTDMDSNDKLALNIEVEDLPEDDIELDEYMALMPQEKLDKVVNNLRTIYHYCLWCKHRYTNAEMDGCPGMTEDKHD